MRLKSLTNLNTSLLLLVCLSLAATLWWSQRALQQPQRLMSLYLQLSQAFQQQVAGQVLAYLDSGDALRHQQAEQAARQLAARIESEFGTRLPLRTIVDAPDLHTLVRAVGLCPPGTFVRLDNGDIAVVLRRSEKANHPLVASIIDARGEPRHEPRLHQTAVSKPRVQSALARSAVTVELNHRTMVRLGLYAAQHSQELRSMVTVPGALY